MFKRVALFATVYALVAATPALAAPDGKALYASRCAACHQATGKGVKGAFPALAGSALVLGDPAPLAKLTLKGQKSMPGFASLSDDQLAAILTYSRGSWGNAAKPVSPSQIAAARK